MGIISWIIVGLIAGALGKMILPGDDPGGFIVTILIGMAGALVGGLELAPIGGQLFAHGNSLRDYIVF
jgi:uncharacterized membrane protein YeaQ/YmgE (transglycosylase-associated protein family)